ncbi:MAG: sulfatase [bacterium]|nr:sulfatase [bacterium]
MRTRFVLLFYCVFGAFGADTLNVLFIAVDDLRPTLGCYGDPAARTPAIDRLASRGLTFDRAYCQQAVCNPSRQSLLTGRRPDTIGVWDLKTHFRQTAPEVVPLPEYFKQRGYFAQSFGKIYHGRPGMQDAASWSVPEQLHRVDKHEMYLLPENQSGEQQKKMAATEAADVPDIAYPDGRVADRAVEALRVLARREQPFFLAVGFRKPHVPFTAPKRYWDLYRRAALAKPENPLAPKGAPALALHNSVELRGYIDIPNKGPIADSKIAEMRHGYYAAVSYIDAQVGRLLDTLAGTGLERRTVVILWSDHGYHLGEHGLWCKTTNFELDSRVPMILAVPDQRNRGVHTRALVELVDVYPTLLELCGLPAPEGLEGRSMKPLLDNPDREWKRAVFSQFPRPWPASGAPEHMGYSIRTDSWRYTLWLDWETKRVVAEELYDEAADPRETTNLARSAKHADRVAELRQMLYAGPNRELRKEER